MMIEGHGLTVEGPVQSCAKETVPAALRPAGRNVAAAVVAAVAAMALSNSVGEVEG